MSNSTKLAHSLLRQLIEVGVSDFVVSPGSRNAPFLIALGEAASKQIIDLHVKIDERGAAFLHWGFLKQAIIMWPLFAQAVLQLQTFTQPRLKHYIAIINCY